MEKVFNCAARKRKRWRRLSPKPNIDILLVQFPPLPVKTRRATYSALNPAMRVCVQRLLRSGVPALTVVLMMIGCTTMAQVTNLSDASCRTSLTHHLSAILMTEGERPVVAEALAGNTVITLSTYDLGPRPFAIAAPSGTDYRFFIDRKGTDCVLTLFGRRRGFVSYTNNLTYIATKTLPDCTCTE